MILKMLFGSRMLTLRRSSEPWWCEYFNSITVDGLRQDDDFGLNFSGYPGVRSPISLFAVGNRSQSLPFDVRYGNFLGGNVNVVTKSVVTR